MISDAEARRLATAFIEFVQRWVKGEDADHLFGQIDEETWRLLRARFRMEDEVAQ
jgi:hypothetical protein